MIVMMIVHTKRKRTMDIKMMMAVLMKFPKKIVTMGEMMMVMAKLIAMIQIVRMIQIVLILFLMKSDTNWQANMHLLYGFMKLSYLG